MNSIKPFPILLIYSCLLSVITLLPVVSSAQIPDKFTNLRVLDSSITKPQLMDKMKMMATSLGVRCEFCHTGNPAEGFKSFDFASDDKEQKKTARIMMIMTEDINKSHLSKLAYAGDDASAEVTCFTCHHSDSKPRLLEAEIKNAAASGGLDSAVTRYQELKEKYYGSSVYDFSEYTLNAVAMELASEQKYEDAVGILQLNEKQFPNSGVIKEMFALLYMRSGNIEKAIEMCNTILHLDPDNRRVQQMLKQLQGN